MKTTRVCKMLGIRYPVLQGGMLWLATAELAAAVSNAGALGVISPYAGMDQYGDPVENLRSQIAKIKKLTEMPFGVNIPLDLEQCGLLVDVLIREDIEIAITSAGTPAHFTQLMRLQGMKVLHVVSSVSQALSAEANQVDLVVAEGVEAAAHLGRDEIPLFSLVPQVCDAVSIPVIAAGGIADARGLAAAFCLGAEGVQLGTRFVAVEESIAHTAYKQAILEAGDNDTIITSRSLFPTRSLKTDYSETLLELEKSGASADKISEFLGFRRSRRGQIEGDLTGCEVYGGSSVGLVKDIVPAATVIERLVENYQEVIKSL